MTHIKKMRFLGFLGRLAREPASSLAAASACLASATSSPTRAISFCNTSALQSAQKASFQPALHKKVVAKRSLHPTSHTHRAVSKLPGLRHAMCFGHGSWCSS